MDSCDKSERRKRGWCTWPIATAFLLSLAATIILILALGPIEEGVSRAMPDFQPIDFNDDEFSGFIPDDSTPTESPGMESDMSFTFMQCPDEGRECCNGLESNCKLRLNEMFFAVAHNAMSTEESGYEYGFNHYKNLDGALRVGYRGLNLDICKCGDQLRFCHAICGYGDRDPSQVFLEIMAFLNEHPTEFLVIVFQFSTGFPSIAELFGALSSVDGFVDKMYVLESTSLEWPTLRDLLERKKQIIAFYHDAKDDCSLAGSCPDQLHDYFNYTADTEYVFQNISAIENIDTSCRVTRGASGLQALFNVNSFVTPPNPISAQTINAKDFMLNRLEKCSSATGLSPNFAFVDFWSEGDLPEVAQIVNAKKASSRRRHTVSDL